MVSGAVATVDFPRLVTRMATGPDDESRVYVGNLLPRAKETHLQAQFARFGVIHNIWVARKVRSQPLELHALPPIGSV